MRIRNATLADIDAASRMFDSYRQFYGREPDFDLAKSFLSERLRKIESIILLAETDEQKIIGFCQLYPSFCSLEAGPIYSLYDLFVHPEARRQGAGKALLEAAEKLAAEYGKVRMDLTTAKTNHTAQAAYEALGWVRDDVYFAYSKTITASI